MSKTWEFHFSLGNSSKGPVGFCAEVSAESQEQAVNLLKAALPTEIAVEVSQKDHPAIGYVCIYLNPDAVAKQDIDDSWDSA